MTVLSHDKRCLASGGLSDGFPNDSGETSVTIGQENGQISPRRL
jgi:hypothetical protein